MGNYIKEQPYRARPLHNNQYDLSSRNKGASKIKNSRKKPRTSEIQGGKFLYFILNTTFGTIFFILGYVLFISNMPHDYKQLIILFIWSLVGGFFVSLMVRLILKYWDTDRDIQSFLRNAISSLISSLLIFFGIKSLIFAKYTLHVDSFIGFFETIFSQLFWEFILILFIIKFATFLFADWISNKIAFGG